MRYWVEDWVVKSLIKDDLIHAKLIKGLNEMGLNAFGYTSYLSETIFKLMKIENDEVYEYYLETVSKAVETVSSNADPTLDLLAERIYQELISYKQNTMFTSTPNNN